MASASLDYRCYHCRRSPAQPLPGEDHATSGKSVETAGDIDIVLLDKTGTIIIGNRRATDMVPVEGYSQLKLAMLAALASAADETPEGKSIVLKAQAIGVASRDLSVPADTQFIPFSAGAPQQPRRPSC